MMDLDDSENGPILESLFHDLNKLANTWTSLQDASSKIYNIIQTYHRKFLNVQTTTYNNEEFQDSLFTLLENVVMAVLHKKLFSFICSQNYKEDEIFYRKCCEFSQLNVTPDQLGALEDYSIPLPAAVVELASLDVHETPMDKLVCLSTSFDLTMAELKGAIVDVIALTADNTIPVLNVSDITPILATIIIRAKPIHLISNLFYIQHFRWSKISSNERECLLAFETAMDKLHGLTFDLLLPRSKRVYCDIGLEDVIKITSDIDRKYDENSEHRVCKRYNPLERHIEHFTNMITASTVTVYD